MMLLIAEDQIQSFAHWSMISFTQKKHGEVQGGCRVFGLPMATFPCANFTPQKSLNDSRVELTNGWKTITNTAMRSSTLSKVLGILALAIVIGGLIGWWASRNSSQPVLPSVPEVSDPDYTAPALPPKDPPALATNLPPPPPDQPEVVSTNLLDDPALWEDKLDEILGSDTIPEDKKGEQLIQMMGMVGTEAQVELAGHIVNLVDDEQFHKAAKYLTNAIIPEEVSSIFMNDLYNRDDTLKLPLFLEVARNEQHPLRDEAKDLLELYVEEDHGTDWVKWEEATKKYLKEHGGEEPEPATGDAK